MDLIRPSEGGSCTVGQRVQVEGYLADIPSYRNEFGGRWIIPIGDSQTEGIVQSCAVLTINRHPEQNSALPPGVSAPL